MHVRMYIWSWLNVLAEANGAPIAESIYNGAFYTVRVHTGIIHTFIDT
jgi:hypothetical protein